VNTCRKAKDVHGKNITKRLIAILMNQKEQLALRLIIITSNKKPSILQKRILSSLFPSYTVLMYTLI
jgi:hypothetical protein